MNLIDKLRHVEVYNDTVTYLGDHMDILNKNHDKI